LIPSPIRAEAISVPGEFGSGVRYFGNYDESKTTEQRICTIEYESDDHA
jgi:hypothetical protein